MIKNFIDKLLSKAGSGARKRVVSGDGFSLAIGFARSSCINS